MVAFRNSTLCSIFVLFIFELTKTYKIENNPFFFYVLCIDDWGSKVLEAEDTWRLTSPLPSGRSDISAATLENYILVFGDSEKYLLYR